MIALASILAAAIAFYLARPALGWTVLAIGGSIYGVYAMWAWDIAKNWPARIVGALCSGAVLCGLFVAIGTVRLWDAAIRGIVRTAHEVKSPEFNRAVDRALSDGRITMWEYTLHPTRSLRGLLAEGNLDTALSPLAPADNTAPNPRR